MKQRCWWNFATDCSQVLN